MKTFIKKIIYIAVIAFVAQYAIGKWLHGYRNNLLEETYFPIKRWDDFYSQPKDSIDLLFLGSSHCYRSFVPSVFDSALNINSFNLGSSSQSISTSFYVLKEALKSQTPELVILEIFHGSVLKKNPYVDVFHNFPQMQSSVKYRMLTTLGIKEAISLAAFPLNRVAINKDQLLLNEKKKPDTNRIRYSIYDHKGYVATHAKEKFQYSYNGEETIKFPEMNKMQMKYLKKIINLCNRNNIKLMVVTQPLHPKYWKDITNYKIYNQMDSILKKQKVPYYNLNQIAPLPDSVFYDTGHILHEGAQIFSNQVADIIKMKNIF